MCYDRTISGVRRRYKVEYLWSKAKTLPIREINPRDIVEFEWLWQQQVSMIWGGHGGSKEQRGNPDFSMAQFQEHTERVISADLEYPIIVDPNGRLMDGVHRLMKAVIEGKKVKVVQFEEWPEPDLE